MNSVNVNESLCLDQATGQNWTLINGDSAEVLPAIPDSSVGLVVTSIPFAATYCYSPSARDLGNVASNGEFWQQMAWVSRELKRVVMPGRLVCLHVANLPRYANRDEAGESGRYDFRGETIRHFEAAGFVYHSEATVQKNPQRQAIANHSKGLLFVQLKRDSAAMWQAWADYLIVMRVPGRNPAPVKCDLDEDTWVEWAAPVWWGIRETATLDGNGGLTLKEADDDKHLCLARGSLVLTRSGYLPIEDVEVGDLVLTHTGQWRPVTAKRCTGSKPTLRLTAQGVADLRLTPDHPLWLRSAGPRSKDAKHYAQQAEPLWAQAQEALGSYVHVPLPPIEESPLTAAEWWIVGRWLGDGHISSHPHTGKRNGYPGSAQLVISCGKEERDALLERLGEHGGHVSAVRTGYQIAIRDPQRRLWRVISQCGRGANAKRVPGEALALCREKADALLSGYLSADGHYVARYDRWTATSVSRRLLLGMALVAQRARGVGASVYAGRPPGVATIEGRTVTTQQEWVFGFRNSPGYRHSGWIDEAGAWKKVRTLTDAGSAEVWDIQVADDESFVAEGCVVHNCPLQLPFIERCVRLWSNPGDVVLDPFAGIGSVPSVAVKLGRKALGIELKPSYWRQSVAYVKRAEVEMHRPTLFDFASAPDQGTLASGDSPEVPHANGTNGKASSGFLARETASSGRG